MTGQPRSLRITAASGMAVALTLIGASLLADRDAQLQGSMPTFGTTVGDMASLSRLDASAESPRPLSKDTIDGLTGADVGMRLTPTQDALTVPFDMAADSASSAMGSMVGDALPMEASVMRTTIPDYGIETQPDPTRESAIAPFVSDRLCWVLVFEDAAVPFMGTYNGEGAEVDQFASGLRGNIVVVLDARTGGFLRAETY